MLTIPSGAKAHFASDLHLSLDNLPVLNRFERWLASCANPNDSIFLLGDIFEAWIGDDYSDQVSDRVAYACQQAVSAGARVFLMQGNRDFLLAEGYAEHCGAELLPDPEFIEINSHIVLLSHGDSFCTDDKAYIQFKKLSRSDKWKDEFLAKSIDERLQIASHIRGESKKHNAMQTSEIMDVNPQAIANAYAGKWPDGYYIGKCSAIIHGHTHRCNIHTGQQDITTLSNTADNQGLLTAGLRFVLPDWRQHLDDNKCIGGFLTVHASGEYSLTQWK